MSTLNGFSLTVVGAYEETSDGYTKISHGKQYSLRLHNAHRGSNGCVPADVEVFIDGKSVGTFRINYGQTIYLERSVNDNGMFTAFKADSSEGKAVGLDANDDNCGLIKAVFRPGKVREHPVTINYTYTTYPWGTGGTPPCKPYEPIAYGVNIYDTINTSQSHHNELGDYLNGSYCKGSTIASNTTNSAMLHNTLTTNTANCCCNLEAAGTGLTGQSSQSFTDIKSLEYQEPATTIMLRLAIAGSEPRPLQPVKKVYTTNYPRKLR